MPIPLTSPRLSISILVLAHLPLAVPAQTVTPPTPRQWHRISLTFAGPSTYEIADPSPFLDYRLDVTFTGPSDQVIVVPGFYAADGNAAVTGATSGDKWRVHFSPDETGEWSYLAAFVTGTNVAVDDTESGTPTHFHGTTGALSVAESDKTAPDFRAPERGLLKNRGHHYFTFASNKTWVKGGTNIPENLLAYDGFDNTPTDKHKYLNHLADWNPGDPDWNSPNLPGIGDGRRLIGALNYIGSTGTNCIYFLPMNIGGDGDDTFPTVASFDKISYDVSKLGQWEIFFSHAQSLGIFFHFQLSETEEANENYHDNGELGPERKLYYRELVARFGHHPGLQWDLGEESNYGDEKHIAFAQHIKTIDPYDHPLTVHNRTNNFNSYYVQKLGNPDFDLTAFQATLAGLTLDEPESRIEQWRRFSHQSGVPWMISVDEPGVIENNKTSTTKGYPYGRTSFLWPIFLNGAGGFEWYIEEDGGGHALDQELEDFRDMDVALEWTGLALEFLDTLPLIFMEPRKDLASSTAGGTTFCLAQPGGVYALYNDDGGTFSLDLSGHEGAYTIEWFNPRVNEGFQPGTIPSVSGGDVRVLGSPPNTVTEDWAVRVSRTTPQGQVLVIRGGDRTGGFLEGGNDAERTEHLSDIYNDSTTSGNHGWNEFRLLLEDAGFVVNQIAEGSEAESGPNDGIPVNLSALPLEDFDLILFGSNNAGYGPEDAEILENYVRGGGSALFISDANWGGDWTDAPSSDQVFLDRFGVIKQQDQGTYTLERSQGDFLNPAHPILANVDAFAGEGVSPTTLGAPVPEVYLEPLVKAKTSTRDNFAPFGAQNQGNSRPVTSTDFSLLVGEVGAGRFACHFDRNTFFNQGGAGAQLNKIDNGQYGINLVSWLAAASPGDCTEFLSALPPGSNGPSDNADRDPYPNLLEYALGLDPLTADGSGAMTPSLIEGIPSLTFSIDGTANDVAVRVQVSEDLTPGSWTDQDIELTPLSRGADGLVAMTARAIGIHAGKKRLFMRLVAEKVE